VGSEMCIRDRLTDERSRRAVEALEAQADGQTPDYAAPAHANDPSHEWQRLYQGTQPPASVRAQWNAADAVSILEDTVGFGLPDRTEMFWRALRRAHAGGDTAEIDPGDGQPPTWAAPLLRDIFGSPWRPVRVSWGWKDDPHPACADCGIYHPATSFQQEDGTNHVYRRPPDASAWLAWNDGAVRKMAQAIYDDRAFDRMPLLADALEEAGWADEAVLMHCRDCQWCGKCAGSGLVLGKVCDGCDSGCYIPGEGVSGSGLVKTGLHVRGCWVIDLLLGK